MTCYETKKIGTESAYSDASLFGAFPSGTDIELVFTAPRREAFLEVGIVVKRDGKKETSYYSAYYSGTDKDMDRFTVRLNTSDILIGESAVSVGLFFYCWKVITHTEARYFGGELSKKLTEYSTEDEASRQLLVYSSDFQTPEYLKGGIVYQIFPDRFRKSGKCVPKKGAIVKNWDDDPSYPAYPGAIVSNNDFFCGDLYGVAEKLDYLSTLGITAVYLNPIFESSSNHRYDTGDMMKVDSALGGDAGLVYLIENAEKKGIKIILDGVFNHTGSDSVYFNKFGRYGNDGAYNSKESEYFSWFCFDEYPDKYRSWWGIDILPKVNCDDETYRNFIEKQFLTKWMSLGVSGWRIDVADELTDSFLAFLRENVKNREKDAVLIGEVWEDASNKISYGERRAYLTGNELDGVMNYPLRNALIAYLLYADANRLRDATEGLYRRYPKPSSDVSFNVLGSHDTVRILTSLSGESDKLKTNGEKSGYRMSQETRALAIMRLKAAYSTVCALPGVPVIYYGDEVGVEGFGDPFCRGSFPWGKEDGELLEFYRKEGEERRKEPLLAKGLFEIVHLDGNVFAFVRTPVDGSGDALLTVLNRSGKTVEISFAGATFTVGPIGVIKRKINCSVVKKTMRDYG